MYWNRISAIKWIGIGIVGASSIMATSTAQDPIRERLFLGQRYKLAEAIAIGDVDGDGDDDVVLGGDDPQMLLSDGDRSFTEVTTFSQSLPAMQLHDLDGDGDLDLLGVSFSQVRTSFGDGAGDFASPVSWPCVPSCSNIPISRQILGDYDEDGLVDLLLIDSIPNQMHVLINKGNGQFKLPTLIPLGITPDDSVAGDWNDDEHLDVAVSDRGEIYVFFGNGNGTFQAPLILLFGGAFGLNSLQAVDANEDGQLDILALDAFQDRITLIAGDGAGQFPTVTTQPTSPNTTYLKVLDANLDGHTDVLLGTANDVLDVRLGNGDGSFSSPKSLNLPTPFFTPRAGLGDFDSDGRVDVFTSVSSPLFGFGDGTFEQPGYVFGDQPVDAVSADFDSDGKEELAVIYLSDFEISLYTDDGSGEYGPAETIAFGQVPGNVASSDLNSDGFADLVFTDFDLTVKVMLGSNNGLIEATTNPIPAPVPAQPTGLACADFDQDGQPDCVVTVFPQGLYYLSGDGSGGFGEAQLLGDLANLGKPQVADLNDDRVPDLVLPQGGSLLFLAGNENAGLSAPVTLAGLPFVGNSNLHLADLNSDGLLDLLITELFEPSLLVALGNGDTTFQTATQHPTSKVSPSLVDAQSATTADFDDDGLLDVAVTNAGANSAGFSSEDVAILFGNGLGGLSAPHSFVTGQQPTGLRTTDLDADGRTDLVVFNSTGDSVRVLRNRSIDLEPQIYCTAKASSAGCMASIGFSGPLSQPASGAADFEVTATEVHELKVGILFGGISGSAALPFNNGTLCVQPPLKRGSVQSSLGSDFSGCQGNFSTIINDGAIAPSGLDAGPGQSGWYQYWHRDPQNGFGALGTALSNGIELSFF